MKTIKIFVVCVWCFSSFAQKGSLTTVLQKGHAEVVKTVALSPNGKLLATGSRDKTIKLWDVATGFEIRTLFGSESTVNDVCFSADGKQIAGSCADNHARIWEVQTGELLWTSPKSKDYTTSVSFAPNGTWLAVGGYDWTAVVYDVLKNDTIASFKVSPDKGLGFGVDLQFSADGKYLAVGEDNRLSTVYATATWQKQFSHKPQEGSCGGCATLVAFSSNNSWLAKLNKYSGVELVDIETETIVATIKTELESIRAIQFSAKNDHLLVATEDSVLVFSILSKQLITAFKPDVEEINDAVFSAAATEIYVAGNDNKVTVWNFKGERIKEYSGILNQRDKGGIDYDPNNYWQSHIAKYIKNKNELLLIENATQLLRGKMGKHARLTEVSTGKVVMDFAGHDKAVLCVAITKDEKQLVTGGGDGKVCLWDMKTGALIRQLEGHRNDPIFDVVISNDQQKVATCGWDGNVIVWNIATGEQISKMYLGNVAAYSLSFSTNDVYLLLGKLDKTLELWEIDSKQMVKAFLGHTDIVRDMLWLNDGSGFYTTGQDGYTILWDLYSGLIKQKTKQKQSVNAIKLLDDKRVITACDDRVIRIWDRVTGKLIKELPGHQAAVTTLNVSVQNDLLVSSDIDGVVKFWKLTDFTPFFEHIQLNNNDWLIQTTDGSFYATDGALHSIHFVKGLETYSLDQFYETFYNPELLPELFQSREKSKKKDMGGLLEQSPPPIVTFGLLPIKTENEISIQLKIKDAGGGAKDIQVFHNGKRLNLKQIQFMELEKGNDYSVYSFTTGLVVGHNVFSAKAYSEQNIASLPVEIDVESEKGVQAGKCYVLSVGINEYLNPKLALNYAKNDAISFVEQVKEIGGELYSEVEVVTLFDANATKENILQQFDILAEKMNKNDVFILFYAGHGSVVEDHFYFIPTEATHLYDEKEVQSKAIDAEEFQEKLQQIKALKQVIIMDACQSGKSVDLLAQRGVLEEKAIAQLSRSAGIHVLASAGSEQYATEYVQLGHGLFTYVLLEALSGKADGGNKDGKITMYEIKSYIDDQVPERSLQLKGKLQFPYSFSRGHDFPIGVVK